MVKNSIIDTTLKQAISWGNNISLIDELVLSDSLPPTLNRPAEERAPLRLNFILMALCRKGWAHYDINTKRQVVKPGDLLFVSERHIVDNYMASPDFECQSIMVSTSFYHGFVQNVKNVSSLLLFSMNNPVVQLTPREVQTYSNYFQTIREKMSDSSHHYRTELVKALLLAMFYDMSGVIYRVEQNCQQSQSRADGIFANFIHLLEEHFRTERRVSWYAEQLNITPKYLAEIVKQVSKRTPNEWIDNYVILEMRVLLKNSTKNIKEITQELHFPNQSFLGKYFKEHVGVSPSEYRKG